MQQGLTNLLIAFFIFIAGLTLFTLFLFNREFSGQEAPLAVYAEYMIRNGLSYFPQNYQGFSSTYFTTPIWLIYFSSTALGKFTVFSALLPTAIASALCLAFTYLVAASQSRDWGIVSVLFMLFNFLFFNAARSITPELYLLALSTILFYCLYSADFYRKSLRLFFLPIVFFLGFMVNGLPGLLLLTVITVVYCFLSLKMQRLLYVALWVILVAIIGIALLLYTAYLQNGSSFAESILHTQIATALIPVQHIPWNTTTLKNIGMSYMFTLVLSIVVIILRWREIIGWRSGPQINLLRQLLGWGMVVIFFGLLYLPLDSLLLYLTPCSALIAAYLFIGNYSGPLTLAFRKLVFYLFCLVPIIALLLALTGLIMSFIKPEIFAASYQNPIIVLALICLFEIYLIMRSKQSGLREFYAILFATLSFIVLFIGILQPIAENCGRTAPFAAQLSTALNKQTKDIVFYDIPAGTDDLRLMAILNTATTPQFINTPQQLLNYQKPAYFIAKSTDYATFPSSLTDMITIIAKGNLGCNSAIIFTINKNPATQNQLNPPGLTSPVTVPTTTASPAGKNVPATSSTTP